MLCRMRLRFSAFDCEPAALTTLSCRPPAWRCCACLAWLRLRAQAQGNSSGENWD